MIFIIQCFRIIAFIAINNVSADVSSGLLQALLAELGRLHGTSNHVLYLINEVTYSDPVNHNQV